MINIPLQKCLILSAFYSLLTLQGYSQKNIYSYSNEIDFKDTIYMSNLQLKELFDSKYYKRIKSVVHKRMEQDSTYWVQIHAEFILGRFYKHEIYKIKTNITFTRVERKKLKRNFQLMLEKSDISPLAHSPDGLLVIPTSFHY